MNEQGQEAVSRGEVAPDAVGSEATSTIPHWVPGACEPV